MSEPEREPFGVEHLVGPGGKSLTKAFIRLLRFVEDQAPERAKSETMDVIMVGVMTSRADEARVRISDALDEWWGGNARWVPPAPSDDPTRVDVGMPTRKELMDALETAWTLLANVGAGEWQHACTEEWIEAAERFRDGSYHPLLRRWVETHGERPVSA